MSTINKCKKCNACIQCKGLCQNCNIRVAQKLQELVKEEIKSNELTLQKLPTSNGFYDEIRIVNQNLKLLQEESEK